MNYYLSYLMGAELIKNEDLKKLETEISETTSSGNRKLKIPEKMKQFYVELIENKLNNGFWNEIVGPKEILFIFKHKNGTVRNILLDRSSEAEIANLCEEFMNDPNVKVTNVYKFLADNEYYKECISNYYIEYLNK